MKQQINLLEDELRQKRTPLTFSQLVMAWGAFAVLLVLVSGWDGAGLWRLTATQSETEKQWRLLNSANTRLKQTVTGQADSNLAAEVEILRQQEAERTQLMGLLVGYQTDKHSGFSLFLNDLSFNHVEGMWLNKISLEFGGERIQLKGITTDPTYLPVFLKSLSAGSSFKGHRFDEFEIKENEKGLLEFDITGPVEVPG